jgi:hypothetical protein
MRSDNQKANSKRYYDSHPEMRVLASIRQRSKKEGIPFNLTIADIVIPATCPVLNVPIGWEMPRDFKPSVDRVDPAGGYVRGNIRVISWLANRKKQDSTLSELVDLAVYVAAHNSQSA